jgi:hypothetical protein
MFTTAGNNRKLVKNAQILNSFLVKMLNDFIIWHINTSPERLLKSNSDSEDSLELCNIHT